MKRGVDTSGSAAATAGLNRSVCPAASSDAAPLGGVDQPIGVGHATRPAASRRAPATPRSMNGSATSTCDSVGTATLTASTADSTSAAVGERPVRDPAAISSARPGLDVDDADQLDVVHRRQQPRVMLAEMADADDGDT